MASTNRTNASGQVQYGQIQDRLHHAFDLAVQRGHDTEVLPAVIESALDTCQPPGQADAVYDELPPGLIDLPSAAASTRLETAQSIRGSRGAICRFVAVCEQAPGVADICCCPRRIYGTT